MIRTIAFSLLIALGANAQTPNFAIRTITAGVTMKNLNDTASIRQAITFLKQAQKTFTDKGYVVQTLRISTQPFHQYLNGTSYDNSLTPLATIDKMLDENGVILAIGSIIPENYKGTDVSPWALKLVNTTQHINFSITIASEANGISGMGVHQSALVIATLADTEGGEGNFRFAAAANCPANIPFFPVAFHEGANSFGIGIESPNILKSVFAKGPEDRYEENLKLELEKVLKPIEKVATDLSRSSGWKYDGIDTSTAPGLDASIGEAIETMTGRPFGSASTLSACAMITGVLKSVDVKRCGYSGLMLPVIEDKVLAQRASEGRFTVQELLLYSSVSGTGLDVVPLPGETTITDIENLLVDVAALSLKYTNKALSARLFPIPGKKAGDLVTFDNPYLTPCRVMKIE